MNSPNYLVWMRVKYELTTKGLVSRGSDPDPVNVQPDPQLCWASMNSPNYLVWMRVKYELAIQCSVSRGSDPDPVNVQPDPQLWWAGHP